MNGLLLWMAALLIAALLAIGISDVGAAAIVQAQASSAADAAALAGAAAGVDAAAEAAVRNGALLVSFSQNGNVVTVTVQRSDARSVAHAERILVPVDGP